MLQEKSTKQEVAIIVPIQGVLSNCKLTDFIALVEVCFWAHFKDCLADLEGDWFHDFGNFVARLQRLAESFIAFAIKVFEICSPFIL